MGAPRPKLTVMSLTDAAATRVKHLMAKANPPAVALRIGVKKGGCAGMEYTMDYADTLKPGEDVVEDKGVTIAIDPSAVLFLLGTTMDFKTDKMSSGFVFNNPNETSACGCGESVAITPARPEALAGALS
ncbi:MULTISPECIES: iron-sulfur cluster assembly accessory protein [unclassified Chelatococcus]|uniref:HesB/IscA family protein n=1 Tax=unclassified Chelatococcus TaxID=2638111 RepID=UPI001BCFDC67|nr:MULTISPECIES: iron-sulfur cluster assembly accessory protein [unclassified Chelatococcus]CAH1672442.1 Iron-sulfur cluster assembly protein [Hyphomicrobiales bacterium]MBS7738590.1 iron-sulfur cluster assembly accessory protein [Chelatococcus sp. HY11]MBX3542994.1 iron-sulfur cluster assembly accessory protein [Chelatococcus sp.]MCO5076880.1 iron-sulfur cluster assembly accessory protein [Chelatococcus sp.]CAH1675322.1 Iron-sulfur cluster assembly protein [Hyphomicrobiales bacterium]